MNNHKNYTTNLSKRARILLIVLLALIVVAGTIYMAALSATAYASNGLSTCYVMCKPGTQVNVRRQPTTDSKSETQLDSGEPITTDWQTENGWLRVYGVGENGGGWVFSGYVTAEEPVRIGQRYVCVAKSRVACRRWMNGPQIENNGRKQWVNNLENVDVFLMADGWALTSKGYIQAEWLECDPE